MWFARSVRSSSARLCWHPHCEKTRSSDGDLLEAFSGSQSSELHGAMMPVASSSASPLRILQVNAHWREDAGGEEVDAP